MCPNSINTPTKPMIDYPNTMLESPDDVVNLMCMVNSGILGLGVQSFTVKFDTDNTKNPAACIVYSVMHTIHELFPHLVVHVDEKQSHMLNSGGEMYMAGRPCKATQDTGLTGISMVFLALVWVTWFSALIGILGISTLLFSNIGIIGVITLLQVTGVGFVGPCAPKNRVSVVDIHVTDIVVETSMVITISPPRRIGMGHVVMLQ